MFCERWYVREAVVDTTFSLKHAIFIPVLFYILWQIFYSLKTDVLDRQKLENDKEMITSAKWLGEIRPHPVYMMLVKKGYNLSPTVVLIGFQLLYTFVTLIPALLAYHFFWVHVGILLLAFTFAAWYGAQYYFEVFSMNYSKRLQKHMDEVKGEPEPTAQSRYGPSSLLSFASFIFFFILFISCFISMVVYFCT